MASSRLSKDEKEDLVHQFREVTQATRNEAAKYLQKSNHQLHVAIDAYLSGNHAPTSTASTTKVNSSRDNLSKLFDKYKDDDGEEITIDGAMSMCEDLEISPEDVVMLPLSFYLKSPSLGTFQREPYIDGWLAIASGLGNGTCDTLAAQRDLLPKLRGELQQDATVRGDRARESKQGLFHRTYEFTYTFARPEGQKSLPMESAIAFWDLVIPHAPTFGTSPESFTARQLNMWKAFLQQKGSNRAISKDTWMLFLDFTGEIDADFKSHDFDAAWPSQIDEFVEWARQQPANSGEAMDES